MLLFVTTGRKGNHLKAARRIPGFLRVVQLLGLPPTRRKIDPALRPFHEVWFVKPPREYEDALLPANKPPVQTEALLPFQPSQRHADHFSSSLTWRIGRSVNPKGEGKGGRPLAEWLILTPRILYFSLRGFFPLTESGQHLTQEHGCIWEEDV